MNRFRFGDLFSQENGHGDKPHPLDKWRQWITDKHPEIVNLMIDEINETILPTLEDDELPAVYVAAANAMIFAGGQFLYDAMTGEIYGEGKIYPKGEILHNLEQARARGHDWLDHILDQYKKELDDYEGPPNEDDESGDPEQ